MTKNDKIPLFCKPITVAHHDEILHEHYFPENGYHIAFRSLQLDTDITMIHDWVNREYALRFWQFNKSQETVFKSYHQIIHDPNGHSFIGLLNGKLVCQVDLYRVLADELHQHVTATKDDCGMHLLMAPTGEQQLKAVTRSVLYTFLEFYFSFPMAVKMYGEPDVENKKAIALIQATGFKHLENITLSYKTAALHCCTRDSFQVIQL